MSDTDSRLTTTDIDNHIEQVGRYSRLAKVGFGIIISAFLLALVGRLPYNLDSVPSAVNAVLLPLIFVGMGFLLLSIGMDLHIMHLNLIKQLRHSREQTTQATDPRVRFVRSTLETDSDYCE